MPVIRTFGLVDRRENIDSHKWRPDITQSGELTLLMAPVEWGTDKDARSKESKRSLKDNGTCRASLPAAACPVGPHAS